MHIFLYHTGTVADFWLTGHIFCGECGEKDSTMQGTSGKSHTGRRHYYYSCKNHRKHKCGLKDVRKDLVEGYVNYLLNEIMNDTASRFFIAEACYNYYKKKEGPGDGYERSLEDSIADIDRQLKNMTQAIADGIYNETTQEYMIKLQEEKKLQEVELAKERARKKYALQFDTVLRFLDSFARDNVGKHIIFDMFIDKIIVFNDKIAVTFHYNDDRREMPISDIIEMIEHDRIMMGPHNDKKLVFGFPMEKMPDEASELTQNEPCEEPDFFG